MTDWDSRALDAIQRVPPGEEFIVDRLWDSIERPDEGRSMGNVLLCAKRKGLIETTGRYELSNQPQCHRNPRSVWRRTAA